MAFTNFCCRSGGSNLNAGTLTGDTTEPGTSASFTYASGNWVQSTGVFTVASGDPASDGVAVGDFASVYADGSSVTGFVGRVTARDSTTITVSGTAKSGTKPTDGTGDRTLKIGGAWLGPNGTSGFPFNFIENACTNSSGDKVRVNFKNDATYSITSGITHSSNIGPFWLQGYTDSYGDLGKAVIDGGTSGASYVLLTMSSLGHIYTQLLDFVFQNNGATGSATGVTVSSDLRFMMKRCVVHDVRGNGFEVPIAIECEAYACNQSNTATKAGFAQISGAGVILKRCISHDNTGSNSNGFYTQTSVFHYHDCISDTNGKHGFYFNNTTTGSLYGCDAYGNGSDGAAHYTATTVMHIENCNFIKNGGYGINKASGTMYGQIVNCGFGAGTQANTSGQIGGSPNVVETGTVTYANDVTPYSDPDFDDFSILLKQARGTGRGAFSTTGGGSTTGYPDIGAAQAQVKGKSRYILGM